MRLYSQAESSRKSPDRERGARRNYLSLRAKSDSLPRRGAATLRYRVLGGRVGRVGTKTFGTAHHLGDVDATERNGEFLLRLRQRGQHDLAEQR